MGLGMFCTYSMTLSHRKRGDYDKKSCGGGGGGGEIIKIFADKKVKVVLFICSGGR